MQEKLKFACECGKVISAPVELAGKKGKCPKCGQTIRIPAVASPTSRAGTVSPALERTGEKVPLTDVVVSPPPPAAAVVPPATIIVCNRCGKSVSNGLRFCPFCDARLPSQALPSDTSQSIQADVLESLGSIRSGSPAAISRLLIVYVALLATNLIAHWIANVMFNEQTPINVHQLTIFTLITEVIDTLIVVMGLALIPRPPKISAWCKRRAFGWLAGIAVLTLALGLNLLYHSLIQNYVQFPKWAHERTMMPLAWGILLVCIQPGVVEELFFRYIALGNLSREMNTVGAVLVSSVMFGMAHSGVFLSIPILTVVGIGFAIARLASGSIVLPMILHALHNGVALYLESTR